LVVADAADPFAVLDAQPEITGGEDAATGGGWVGYLGYGLGRLIEHLPAPPRRPVPVPRSILAFYDHLLTRDDTGSWWFEALWSDEQSDRLESRLSLWRRRASEPAEEPGKFGRGTFSLRPDPHSHLVAVSRAIEHIRSGDVFQVNVCTRLEAGFSGDPIELFCQGAERLAPRYGAFLGHPGSALAGFSPELFLKRRGRHVLSSPIKGTARRQGSHDKERAELLGSEKDRAENLMIVDLVRNDLGRVCRYGSVAVPELWRAEEHPGVWHLVSDVTGELSDGVSDAALLRAAFPPGSVTGAPKVRAMELISVLEGTAREAYTGAVGIASPLSGLELNVTIRTFELAGGRAWLGVGGGVVADSDPAHELEECLDKARPLLEAIGADLETVPRGARAYVPAGTRRGAETRPVDLASGVFETVLVIGGRPVALESHLGRLAASVSSLYGWHLSPRLGAEVVETAAAWRGRVRLRVRVYPAASGEISFEISAQQAPEAFSGSPDQAVSLVPAVVRGGFGRHKWHDRRALSERRGELSLRPHEQLLIVDEDAAVLETEQANIFAVFGSVLETPSLDGRILAGTTREEVIRVAVASGFEVSEGPITLSELASADEVFVTSSIRGLCAVSGLRAGCSFSAGPMSAALAKALWESWTCAIAATVGTSVHGLGPTQAQEGTGTGTLPIGPMP
jgi:para-aminobenzoate synthetase/4-amino-4-deoxychorismate lyase